MMFLGFPSLLSLSTTKVPASWLAPQLLADVRVKIDWVEMDGLQRHIPSSYLTVLFDGLLQVVS